MKYLTQHKGTALFISLGMLLLPFTSALAATTTTVTVNQQDLANTVAAATSSHAWFFYNDVNDTIDNSLGSFVTGPATPPAGIGSAQISVTGNERRDIATYQFAGTPLKDITQLSFATYNPSVGNGGSATRSGYLNFNVDFNNSDTWQHRLAYVPRNNGTVLQNTWQQWNAIASGTAKYSFSGATWPDTTVGPDASSTGVSGTTLRTWSEILADYPDIRIKPTDGWFGIRVGEPYADGYTENIDNVVFGTASSTTVFNFDPFVRTATITAPTANETVSGNVHFAAILHDAGNNDAVDWAVRAGTCNVATTTVAGNVNGFTNPYHWDHTNFSANVDMSSLTPGNYCFIFNPTESTGDTPIRLTQDFTLVAPTPAPTVSLALSSTSINTAASATLSWSSTNATSCTASGNWNGSKATSGTTTTGVMNTAGDYTYTLSCTGDGGTATTSATLHVQTPVVTPPTNNDPGDKSECKQGGWFSFLFRNQGQCVRYTETEKDSRHDDKWNFGQAIRNQFENHFSHGHGNHGNKHGHKSDE